MRVQDMRPNSSILDTTDREAIKVRADAHPQKSLPGYVIAIKTAQAFFKNTCESYLTYWSLSEEVGFFHVRKFSKFYIRSITYAAPAPN